MHHPADSPWFRFQCNGAEYRVFAFSGHERVNEPYEFSIELVHTSSSLELSNLIGKEALLTIDDESGGKREVHGLIRQMEQLHTANARTHYRCYLVPRLWFLQQNSDHRIFQEMDAIQIISSILDQNMFSAEGYIFQCFNKYPAREYCVQYGESDLHFIERLCEEEGIFFLHSHSEEGHRLCFSDMPGGPKIPGEHELRFYPGSGQAQTTAVIFSLSRHQRVNSTTATYKEWNFTRPKLDLEVSAKPGGDETPAPPGLDTETYQYPHLYQLQEPGRRFANIQYLRQVTFNEWIEGESYVPRQTPGHAFSIYSHPNDAVNSREWWVVSMEHKGEQPQVLEHEAPDRGRTYRSAFTAIPAATRFVPDIKHPKRRIAGTQTAIVTGPPGEEVFTDSFGRVKVQFHWDREGRYDDKSSCWVRVSQELTGANYGAVILPRIGHEVIVSFQEGDPDRPLITGRTYNAANMPPYGLPEHKTRMGLKSKTFMGDGSNELRFEDKMGEEQVYIHAQRDFDAIVENESREWVKKDRHLLVEGLKIEEIKGDASSQVDSNRIEATSQKRVITVGEDESHQIGGGFHQQIKKTLYIEGDESGVIELKKDLTLKAPGGFIKIDESGITIQGKVTNINTGGTPGEGKPIQSEPAKAAKLADSRDGNTGKQSERMSQAHQASAPPAAAASSPPFTSFSASSFVAAPLSPSAAADFGFAGALGTAAVSVLRQLPAVPEIIKQSDTPLAGEWMKNVRAMSQEATVPGKMDIAQRFIQKNIAVQPDSLDIRSPEHVLQEGKGNSTELALAKYELMRESGVPEGSMRIISDGGESYLAVADGPETLIAGPDYTPHMPVQSAKALPPEYAPVIGIDATGIFSYSAHS